MGDVNEAQKSAEKALSLATSDADRAIAHDLKASAFFNVSELDKKSAPKAEDEFREAARLAPAVASFHLNLARSLMKQSKDDQAVPELNQCLALSPSVPMADLARRYLANPKRGHGELRPAGRPSRFTGPGWQDRGAGFLSNLGPVLSSVGSGAEGPHEKIS